MSGFIRSFRQYNRTLETIRRLKIELHRLAEQNGNLDPKVIALSQEIDGYIVQVQRYQRKSHLYQVG